MKKKILILLVLYLILPISVNALAGEVYVKCKEDKITTGEKIQCEVKGKRFSDYISSFHSQVVLPQDVKLEEVTVDESWEGSGENGIIDLYTADNKKGNFELISITISSTKEILDIESKITFTNTIVSDANFVEHELESTDIVKQSKNIIPILIYISLGLIITTVIIALIILIIKKHSKIKINKKICLFSILILGIYIGSTIVFTPKISHSSSVLTLTEEEKLQLKYLKKEITYELFGAKGDGKTNDLDAIIAAHEFANELFLETGYIYTVYSCPKEDCSDKTYYIGQNIENGKSKFANVITNVDWRKANFIIDDYIDENNDGKNDVDTSASIFTVTTALDLIGDKYNASTGVIYYNDSVLNELSNTKAINPNTTNLKVLIDALFNGKINKTKVHGSEAVYSNIKSEIDKQFNQSTRWVITVKNSNKQYIRKGSNATSGENQRDIIIIDSDTGDVLTPIDWTYDDITEINVYPVSYFERSIGNGSFTTYTNNAAYDDSGNKIGETYNKRGIYVAFTGHVSLKNINHFVDESKHLFTSDCQTVANGNRYYGFLRIHNSAIINGTNIYLSPHTPVNKATTSNGGTIDTNTFDGTYDLTIENSSNITLDNINYACNIYNDDGTKNYNKCYKDKIINEEKWGIMGSNSSKNVIITNSIMNRIDAHRGITNLYIENTKVGSSNGDVALTLNGQGYFYAKDLYIDSADSVLKLRDDYGSSWNGTMVFDGLTFVVDETSTHPSVIKARNTQNHNFGYDTYFPNVYINDLRIDVDTFNDNKNLKYVTLIDLEPLSSAVDKTDTTKLYNFKDNIYVNNIEYGSKKKIESDSSYVPTVPEVRAFTYTFANTNGQESLNINNYGRSNVVNLYFDGDVLVESTLSTHSTPKFKITYTMENKTEEVAREFNDIKSTFLTPTLLPNCAIGFYMNGEEHDIYDFEKNIKVPSTTKKVSDLKSLIYTDAEIYVISEEDYNQGVFSSFEERNKRDDEIVTTGDRIFALFPCVVQEFKINLAVNGDINGDGQQTVVDVSAMFQHYKNKTELSKVSQVAGDVVEDGEIKLNDVAKEFQYVRKKINSLED